MVLEAEAMRQVTMLGLLVSLALLRPSAAQPSTEPHILHDEAEMRAYLAEPPSSLYKVFTVPGMASFYLEPDLNDNIKTMLRRGQVWEPYNRELLKRYIQPGSVVVDAGAHIGTHTILMSQLVGPTGRVYAFEPQKKIYRELLWNLKLNHADHNVVPLRYALGDKEGVVEMNQSPAGNEGGTAVGHGGDRVELRTLDSFDLDHVSLMKIDVEGFEDYVLKGARRTLAAEHPVLVLEIQGNYNYEDAPEPVCQTIMRSIGLVRSLGYSIRNIRARDYGNHDYLALYDGSQPRAVTIDLGTPEARLYVREGMYEGESYPHGTFAWTQGQKSRFSFWLEPGRGEYSLRIRAHRVLGLPQVISQVSVNGQKIGPMVWKSEDFESQELSFTGDYLHSGENQLELTYDGVSRLAERDPRQGSLCIDLVWVSPKRQTDAPPPWPGIE